MKKGILIIPILASIMLISCNKEYECDCTRTTTFTSEFYSDTDIDQYELTAGEKCIELNSEYTVVSENNTRTYKLECENK